MPAGDLMPLGTPTPPEDTIKEEDREKEPDKAEVALMSFENGLSDGFAGFS